MDGLDGKESKGSKEHSVGMKRASETKSNRTRGLDPHTHKQNNARRPAHPHTHTHEAPPKNPAPGAAQ